MPLHRSRRLGYLQPKRRIARAHLVQERPAFGRRPLQRLVIEGRYPVALICCHRAYCAGRRAAGSRLDQHTKRRRKDTPGINEPQIGFVDERRGLEDMVRTLASHLVQRQSKWS
jgi:hypothetical protein